MNKKIYLCDDNILILHALELVLSMTDATVVSESRSVRALKYIISEKPDLFICDLEMPGLNGDDLIRQIRAQKECNRLFILCISASSNGRDIALNAGADSFLAKPFEIEVFLSIVNEFLST